MAASCPRCGNLIEQDFGVATCPQCQAILFINMDGHAQITEDPNSNVPSVAPATDFPSASFDPDPIAAQGEEPVGSAHSVPAETAGEPASLANDPTSAGPTDEEPSGSGVYESSEQVEGAISYTVKIENIDTKEIRHLMIEALNDGKFQWDPREIVRTVKNGTIELKNLNPVKASVVVQRVRELPVRISWKQNVYK